MRVPSHLAPPEAVWLFLLRVKGLSPLPSETVLYLTRRTCARVIPIQGPGQHFQERRFPCRIQVGERDATVSEHIGEELGNRYPHGLFDVMMNGLQFLESWLTDLQSDIAIAVFQNVVEGKADKIGAVGIVIDGGIMISASGIPVLAEKSMTCLEQYP